MEREATSVKKDQSLGQQRSRRNPLLATTTQEALRSLERTFGALGGPVLGLV